MLLWLSLTSNDPLKKTFTASNPTTSLSYNQLIYFRYAVLVSIRHQGWVKRAKLASCSSADARPSPTSGAGWQRWNRADIDLISRRNPLRNFKYESSSSPGNSPGQEEFRPWALSASPSSREPARMADERPPIWVQLTTEILGDWPLDKLFNQYWWCCMEF